MTGRDLVSASMRLIGALASGEPPAAQEATDVLSALNRMIDSWSNEDLLIFNKVTEVFPLVSSQQLYTMGVGGNFNTSRPQRVEQAYLRVTSTTPSPDLPLEILTLEQWSALTIKTTASSLPIYLFPDDTYPLASLNFWPIPNQVSSVVLSSWKPLATIASLDTVIALPPGYERALVYNGAVEISPEYGKQISEVIASIATESKASLKRMNHNPQYLQVDAALKSQSGAFNWYTGESTP